MKELLNIYREALRSRFSFTTELKPCSLRVNIYARSTQTEVEHTLWMLDVMDTMLDQMNDGTFPHHADLTAKFNRWLGFVQGWLWHQHVFTLDQLREQTRLALQ